MARGRMVSTTVAIDISLNGLSVEAEYLFLKTIPHLDRDGLILCDAPILWGKVCPRRPQFLPRIEELIAEWEKAGLVISYQTPDGRAIFFPGFAKNQTFQYSKEGRSIIPPPPGYKRDATGLVLEEVKPTPETVADELWSNSRVTLAEEKRREEKLREEEENRRSSSSSFDWWQAWKDSFPAEQTPNPIDKKNLQSLVNESSTENVVAVIDYANKHKRTPTISFAYVEKIHAGWIADGKVIGNCNGNGREPPRAPRKRKRFAPDGSMTDTEKEF